MCAGFVLLSPASSAELIGLKHRQLRESAVGVQAVGPAISLLHQRVPHTAKLVTSGISSTSSNLELSRPKDNICCRGCGRRAVLFSSEAMMKAAASGILLLCGSCMSIDISRRRTLRAFSAPVAVAALPMPALAATKKYSAADAQNAIRELKEARVALDGMDKQLAGGDLAAVAAALEMPGLANIEENLTILVQAPVLPAEDKKAIGTIRRYGVAADVIIMTGGLKEAIENQDARGAKSYLAKTKGSLGEVITIARGGGLR